jgi:hypothetical protein
MILREAQLVSVDHFRHELLTQLRSAADQGGTTIVITSGELCKNIRMGNSWTQACFEAMQAEVKPGDDILTSVSGAEMIIRYRLPRRLNEKPARCGSSSGLSQGS